MLKKLTIILYSSLFHRYKMNFERKLRVKTRPEHRRETKIPGYCILPG